MIMMPGSSKVTSKTIRGVQYVVFSFFDGKELMLDRIESLIQRSFEASEADEITSGFSDNCIAIDEKI